MSKTTTKGNSMSHSTAKMPLRMSVATRRYYDNLVALNQGHVTPDQHRAENRAIRATLKGESEWLAVKIRALVQFDR